jgi:hypothetical protein
MHAELRTGKGAREQSTRDTHYNNTYFSVHATGGTGNELAVGGYKLAADMAMA